MVRLHVICQKRLHVTKIGASTFESGYWPITEEDAKRLVGGMLYLHEKKSEASYFGGIIESFRKAGTNTPNPGRMILTFRPTKDMRGETWRGRNDPMVWIGGVIDG